ncbi:MAG: MFS transporter [Clostridiales bacterium]|jgi:Na+/melibiose symporter-like transporter|nr:MFS transporter [Clostridiales bacterium]
MMESGKDIYKSSRVFYVAEAAFEYFIAILIGGAYLAKITSAIGMSDGLTGVLFSFVSLGAGVQIFALFFADRRSVKGYVTVLHTINQLCFAVIYLVPLFNISKSVKIVIFIVLLLGGQMISNIMNASKVNWLMALVPDKNRGRFTATKEIVSLIGGTAFSFAAGAVIDGFESAGNLNGAFIVGAAAIFVFAVLHSMTLIFSKEKVNEKSVAHGKVMRDIKALLKNKTVLKILLLQALWNIAIFSTQPFYGSYQINELGFSMTFIAVLSIIYAVFRIVFSRIFGKFADKHTFVKMLNICYIVACASLCVNMFTVPANGKIFYTVFYTLQAVAMAGINSGAVNLIYDNVEPKQRMRAYALQQSITGVIGFGTTTVMSLLVTFIQKNGNHFLGMNVYAQQVMSAIGALVVVLILVYVNAIARFKKVDKDKAQAQGDGGAADQNTGEEITVDENTGEETAVDGNTGEGVAGE